MGPGSSHGPAVREIQLTGKTYIPIRAFPTTVLHDWWPLTLGPQANGSLRQTLARRATGAFVDVTRTRLFLECTLSQTRGRLESVEMQNAPVPVSSYRTGSEGLYQKKFLRS